MAKVPHLEADMRKKVDGFTMFSNRETEDIKEEKIGKRVLKSLASELKYDLRKSLAWDSAFSTSSGILEVEELFDTSTSWHSENVCDMLGPEQYHHLSFNNLKPEIRTVTDEFNLRKSLAWDSAFFTSEGILNSEELSHLNQGVKKSEMDMLHQMEELWISSESNCAIDSDGSSLPSLEISTSSSRNIQKVFSTKRMSRDSVPKLKVKSWPTSTMQTINTDQPKRIAKQSSVPPSGKFSAASAISDLSSHLKPPKISRGVRRNAPPIAPTKRVPLFSNEVNRESKTVKANGKCLVEKSNLFKTCSSGNSSRFTTLSWEFSSLSSQSRMNDSNGLCSPYSNLSICQSSPEFSVVENDTPNSNSPSCKFTLVPPSKHRITNEITSEKCCNQIYSSVKKKCCCISPSASIDGFSPASSIGESNGFHDDKGNIFTNPCSEVKGRICVSFDASRTVKPSGLRMPSPKIGFFDVDNFLVSDSKDVSKIQSAQTLKDVRNTRTCTWKTRNSTISKTMKFIHGAVSKAGEDLRNDEKMVNVRAHEHEFERQTFAQMDKRGVENKMLREREEQSCLKGKKLLLNENIRANTIYTGNYPYTLHEREKENFIGIENKVKEQVGTLGVHGDVVIEFVNKNCQSKE